MWPSMQRMKCSSGLKTSRSRRNSVGPIAWRSAQAYCRPFSAVTTRIAEKKSPPTPPTAFFSLDRQQVLAGRHVPSSRSTFQTTLWQ